MTRKTFNLPLKDRVLDYLAGEAITGQFRGITYGLFIPVLAIGVFLVLWSVGAAQVKRITVRRSHRRRTYGV